MLQAFLKGFGELGDPRTRRLVWISLTIAVAVFVALWGGVGFLLTETTLFTLGWLDTVVDVLGGLATLVITWLLFPAVLSAAVGLFLDQVADAVERRHYPGWPPARDQSLIEVLTSSLKFLVILVGLNLLLLPFLLVPPLFPFVFYTVNGYLIGREYFEIVALRRTNPESARKVWRDHRRQLFLAGLITAVLLTVPFVNLVVPIAATGAMVHLWAKFETRA